MQKIVPCLWFEDRCEEAVRFYIELFGNSKLDRLKYYTGDMPQDFMRAMEGKVLAADFELSGLRFLALDGGSFLKQTAAVSLFVCSGEQAETQRLWDALSAGGQELMPLQSYPWSGLYGWVTDRFGISWQLYTGVFRQRISPAIMFKGANFGRAEEAMRFWAGVLPGSSVDEPQRFPVGDTNAGKVMHGELSLAGLNFMVMDSPGPHGFDISGAISFIVNCDDQAEIDRYWEALVVDGGRHLPCGWLADRYGVHWQIDPANMQQLVDGPDEAGARRALEAMLQMGKLDKAALEAAYGGH